VRVERKGTLTRSEGRAPSSTHMLMSLPEALVPGRARSSDDHHLVLGLRQPDDSIEELSNLLREALDDFDEEPTRHSSPSPDANAAAAPPTAAAPVSSTSGSGRVTPKIMERFERLTQQLDRQLTSARLLHADELQLEREQHERLLAEISERHELRYEAFAQMMEERLSELEGRLAEMQSQRDANRRAGYVGLVVVSSALFALAASARLRRG